MNVRSILFGGDGINVGGLWRLLGALLALGLLFAATNHRPTATFLYRLDTQIIDAWQRLSGPDEPSGKVLVVGIDKAAIRDHGRWPWPRATLATLVENIAAAGPASITLDILLTEPGPYSDLSLFRNFRQNGGDAIALRGESPDARLARALKLAPTALAIAGGTREAIDEDWRQAQCADPALVSGANAAGYYSPCLLFPLDEFYQVAQDAVTLSDQDLDGVVRRARVLVAQPFHDGDAVQEVFLAAMPLAIVSTCGAPGVTCPAPSLSVADMKAAGGRNSFRLPLSQDGAEIVAPPLTSSLSLWLDFGALPRLSRAPVDDTTPVTQRTTILSADDVLDKDPDHLARIAGKHIVIGLTRLGEIDQHTTPLGFESGTPGAVIQALAADNIFAGRGLDQPPWLTTATATFVGLIALGALLRFGVVLLPLLTFVSAVLLALPIAASWFAFEFKGLVYLPMTATMAAFLGTIPIVFGRMQAIRRDLAEARDKEVRDAERMDAARQIQLGSLPFDAQFDDIGFSTGKICRPAQEVGGDFFELFRLSDGRLFAAVGDVSGKGLEASLVTALSKSIAGAVADRTDGPLGEAMAQISREFVRQAPRDWRLEKGGFVTLVAARIDPENGEAEFAAAGCEPPVIVAADGTLKPMSLPNVAPLGWVEDAQFETAFMALAPGDTIAMFTDGVTEAETPDGVLFEQTLAEEVIAKAAAEGAHGIIETLEAAVLSHQAGGAPTDDTTILTITYRGRS
ncbi:MAG: SpoIIE family protein phosphatase [Pikeienuella sp.]